MNQIRRLAPILLSASVALAIPTRAFASGADGAAPTAAERTPACDADLGTLERKHLGPARLVALAGRDVTIYADRHARGRRGVVVSAGREESPPGPTYVLRFLDFETNAVEVLEFGPGGPNFERIVIHGKTAAVKAAERRHRKGPPFRPRVLASPRDSFLKNLSRVLPPNTPVTIVFARAGSHKLVRKEGRIRKLRSDAATHVWIDGYDGGSELVAEPRIVALYARVDRD